MKAATLPLDKEPPVKEQWQQVWMYNMKMILA